MAFLSPVMTRRPATAAAQRAVGAVFAFNGFVFASWAVRVPDVSHHVGASHASLGVALLCISLGALATMRLTGAVCERLGSGLVCAGAAALVSLSVSLPGLAGSMEALCAALAVFGAAGGMLNVAMNSLGVLLEQRSGRPLLSRLHAAFSFGGLAGGVVGGLVAARVDAGPHLLAVGAVGLLVTGALSRPLLALDDRDGPAPAETTEGRGGAPLRGLRTVLVLGAVAGAAAYGEGALSDWGALHLVQDLGASPTAAAGGYGAFCLAMGCGRLAGRRMLDHLGATWLTVAGSLLAAAGMLLAAHASSVVVACAGLVLVGLGFSNVFPVAMARAGATAGPRGVGLASTVGYGGLLVGPAAIGFIASGAGLPWALTTVSVLAAVAAGMTLLVRHDAPSASRSLPGAAALLDRSRLAAGAVSVGWHGAAARHAASLEALDPRVLLGAEEEPPLRDPDDFTDLDALLGMTPSPDGRRAAVRRREELLAAA
jgi:MFS family permease